MPVFQKPIMTLGGTSVDFDQVDQHLYVASDNSIYRSNLNGEGEEVIKTARIDNIKQLIMHNSVEWQFIYQVVGKHFMMTF